MNYLKPNEILQHDGLINEHNAKVFYNTELEFMNKIIGYLSNNSNTINAVIDTRNIDYNSIIKLMGTIPIELNRTDVINCLLESNITFAIINQILCEYNSKNKIIEHFREKVQLYKQNKIKKFNDINSDTLFLQDELDALMNVLSIIDRTPKDIYVYIFIEKNLNPTFQKVLNQFLNDRLKYYTRFFAESDSLSTYHECNGTLLEDIHDYHSYDLSHINSKVKKKNNK